METRAISTRMLRLLSSYRTYEEWKLWSGISCHLALRKFLPYLWGMETCNVWYCCCTLLTGSYRTYEEWKRKLVVAPGCPVSPFLPYLWGMETSEYLLDNPFVYCSYRTYEEWKRSSSRENSFTANFVLTVPMRNGNPTIFGICSWYRNSSYRTYEEWKLSLPN